jgi:hypothetical protein
MRRPGPRSFAGLEFANSLPQPFPQGGFEFLFCAPLIERIDGFAAGRQKDVAARIARLAPILWNEVNERALRAGPPLIQVLEVDAGWGIFENKIWAPGVARAGAITALFEEGQFSLQNLKEFPAFGHV